MESSYYLFSCVVSEKILLYNNTSIIQDEILCHRLGLVPLKIDPRLIKWRENKEKLDPLEEDTVVFDLHIRCTKNPSAKKGERIYSYLFCNTRIDS